MFLAFRESSNGYTITYTKENEGESLLSWEVLDTVKPERLRKLVLEMIAEILPFEGVSLDENLRKVLGFR